MCFLLDACVLCFDFSPAKPSTLQVLKQRGFQIRSTRRRGGCHQNSQVFFIAGQCLDRFGTLRVEGVTFTGATKEAMAYPVRGAMEDRQLRIPHDPKIRADLRQVTKQVTPSGNIRFTAERTVDGHADHFWALALAKAAADNPSSPIEFTSSGQPRGQDAQGFL